MFWNIRGKLPFKTIFINNCSFKFTTQVVIKTLSVFKLPFGCLRWWGTAKIWKIFRRMCTCARVIVFNAKFIAQIFVERLSRDYLLIGIVLGQGVHENTFFCGAAPSLVVGQGSQRMQKPQRSPLKSKIEVGVSKWKLRDLNYIYVYITQKTTFYRDFRKLHKSFFFSLGRKKTWENFRESRRKFWNFHGNCGPEGIVTCV